MMECCLKCLGLDKKAVKTDSCNSCKARKPLKIIKKTKRSKTIVTETKSIPSLKKLYVRSSSIENRLVPYTFRVPANISHFRDIGSRRAKCPPFHLLLDHVVAVVWCLFSSDAHDKKQLGISQLEWALYFLRGVKNNTGKHPPDVAIAIRTIEDTLMKYYANMSKLVIRQQAQKKKKKNCETCAKKDATSQSKCGICSKASLAYLPRKSKSTSYNSYNEMDSHMESILNTSPQFSSTRKNLYQTPSKQMYKTPENKFKTSSKFSSTKKDYYGKSATQPTMYTTPVNKFSTLPKNTHESSVTIHNNIVELKALIAQLSDSDFLGNTESDDAMAELLNSFRKHQIEKIRDQMKKLQSIETLLYRDRSDFVSSLLNTTSADTHTYRNS